MHLILAFPKTKKYYDANDQRIPNYYHLRMKECVKMSEVRMKLASLFA